MTGLMIRMKCITNLHAGNGDVNYNIVDNEVERDPILQYPTINSSGVKGALRKYFEKSKPDLVKPLFGSDETGNTTPGKLKILAAEMIGIPVRVSKGNKPYALVTTQEALDRLQTLCALPGVQVTSSEADVDGVELEGFQPDKRILLNFGESLELYRIGDEAMKQLSLPVLSRNCLEDGRSTNLWYEEVVPHESVFSFAVLAD
nr:hypothetical protein [Oscillospiraceae bacterium]